VVARMAETGRPHDGHGFESTSDRPGWAHDGSAPRSDVISLRIVTTTVQFGHRRSSAEIWPQSTHLTPSAAWSRCGVVHSPVELVSTMDRQFRPREVPDCQRRCG
jgi:hypothetical protein